MADRKGGHGDERDPVEAPARAPRVLLLEDDSMVSLYLTGLLADFGYAVCGAAATGAKALELAAEQRPELALVDIGLKGGMDGIEAAVALRDRYGVRTIFLSGTVDPATRERAMAARPLDFLSKPYMPEDLEAALKKAVDGG